MDQDSIYGFLSKHENFAAHFNPFHGTQCAAAHSLENPDLDDESAVEVAQNWITAKNRRKVTKRALQTMTSADDIQETDAFADEQELCDEVEIDKFVL